jgi:hypothetical protein
MKSVADGSWRKITEREIKKIDRRINIRRPGKSYFRNTIRRPVQEARNNTIADCCGLGDAEQEWRGCEI